MKWAGAKRPLLNEPRAFVRPLYCTTFNIASIANALVGAISPGGSRFGDSSSWSCGVRVEELRVGFGVSGLRECEAVADGAPREGGPHDSAFHFEAPEARLEGYAEDTARDHYHGELYH